MSRQVQGTPQGQALACLPGALGDCVCPFPGLDRCTHDRRQHYFTSWVGILTHLKTCHGFPSFWSQRIHDPAWATPLASVLTAARHWLCIGCVRVFPFRTRSCSSCGAVFFSAPSAVHPPLGTPVLIPPPTGSQSPLPSPLPLRRATSRRRPRSPTSAPLPISSRRRSSTPLSVPPHQSMVLLPSAPLLSPPPSPTTHTWDVSLVTRVFSLRVPTYLHVPFRVRALVAQALTSALTRAVALGTVEAHAHILLFGACVLSARPRASGEGVAAHIRRRAESWLAGRYDELLSEFLASVALRGPRAQESKAQRCLRNVRAGHFGAAVRALTADAPAAADASTYATLEQMFGSHPQPDPCTSSEPPATCDLATLRRCINRFSPSSAPGPDGFRPSHLLSLIATGSHSTPLLTALLGFVQASLAGAVPPELATLYSSGTVTPLIKASGGLRPIVVGLVLRRLVSKVAVTLALPGVSPYLQPLQLGVTAPGGAEAAVHAFTRFVETYGDSPDFTAAFLDISDAFGSVRRDAFLRQVAALVPGLLPWVQYCYTQPATLFLGSMTLFSTTGVQQGDPLGPLLFALALHPVLLAVHRAHPTVTQGWLLDDGGLMGRTTHVAPAVALFSELAAGIGLRLNPIKSVLWWPTPDPRRDSLFPPEFQHCLAPGVRYLGIPLTRDHDFRQHFLLERLSSTWALLDTLHTLGHPQAELLLLRSCLSTCRVTYFLRCTPPSSWTSLAAQFDSRLRRELCRLLPADGFGFTDTHWRIASLPLSAGGLGLASASLLLESAFLSSYTFTLSLQDRLLPPSTPPSSEFSAAVYTYQLRVPSYSAHQRPSGSPHDTTTSLGAAVVAAERATLLSEVDRRTSSLLLSSSLPHAFAWLLALPDGRFHLTMDSMAFRCRLAYHLGVPLFHPDRRCAFCQSSMDLYGDHALHCAAGRGVSHTFRHHRVRDTVRRLLRGAGFTCVSEPQLPFSSSDGGPVRADLLVREWSGGHDHYLDFVGASPLTTQRLATFAPGAAATTAAALKLSHYASFMAAQDGQLTFAPFAFETLGGLDPHATAFMTELQRQYREARLISEGLMPHSVFTVLSFAIASGVGTCLAARYRSLSSHVFDVF
jgi:hypothetical protein